jgi:hypothetical protein
LKVLKAEVLDSLEKIRDLQNKLKNHNPETIDSNTSEDALILIGYYISGIYSNFEDIFLKVARVFENKLEDPTQWHTELLNRMSLDVEEVRPALISKKSKVCLDELRKFRHMFRFSYAFELDWEKMLLVVRRWNQCSQQIFKDVENFLSQIDQASV